MKFYGELLIFILLLITNLRVFFVEHVKKDPLVCLAPFTFLLAVLQIFSWGLDFFTTLGFLISFLVFLSNFHAMFRYSEQLFVDHYSPLMKTWAFFTTTISTLAIIANILFMPVDINSNKLQVTETKINFTGTFRTGFEKSAPFKKNTAFLYEYKSQENSEYPLIVFLSDKRSDTQYISPYLKLLARENFDVVSIDFFSSDCRWLHNFADNKVLRRFVMSLQCLSDKDDFMSQREFYTYNSKLELEAIKQIISDTYGSDRKYFILCDEMGKTAVNDFEKANSSALLGTFCIDTIPEYKTPGFGVIQQTDPVLALLLGSERDSSFDNPKIMAEKTRDMILAATAPSTEENNDIN